MHKMFFPVLIFLAALGGCAQLESKLGGQPDTAGNPALEQEVNALFQQKYIDPLTRFLETHAENNSTRPYLEAVRRERERRCEEIADRFATKEKNSDTLARLKGGYHYSCPGVVAEFAKEVGREAESESEVLESPPETDQAERETESPPADGEALAPEPETPPAPAPRQAEEKKTEVSSKTLENCYLLFSIKNYSEAIPACRKAAEAGDAKAQYNLGVMHKVLQNYAEALKWTREAVEQGMAEAQAHLAQLYYQGLGVDRNYSEALKWFTRAAEQGLASAQYGAGLMHYQGKAGNRDFAKAKTWFEKAAQQGNVDAQLYLASMYAGGEGVPRDGESARDWLLQAARAGSAEAQYNLGVMYAGGESVSRDPVEAYKWFGLALSNGYREALLPREKLGRQLNQAQQIEAQQRIRQWKANYEH